MREVKQVIDYKIYYSCDFRKLFYGGSGINKLEIGGIYNQYFFDMSNGNRINITRMCKGGCVRVAGFYCSMSYSYMTYNYYYYNFSLNILMCEII